MRYLWLLTLLITRLCASPYASCYEEESACYEEESACYEKESDCYAQCCRAGCVTAGVAIGVALFVGMVAVVVQDGRSGHSH